MTLFARSGNRRRVAGWLLRMGVSIAAAGALALAGCREETSDEAAEAAAEATAVTSATKSPSATGAMEPPMVVPGRTEGRIEAASGLTSGTEALSPAEKEHLAMMGHSLPEPPKDRPKLGADAATVRRTVTGVVLTVPKDWKETPMEELSPLRLAQFAVPAAGSDKGAEMVVYNFGPGQGGSAMANVQRWLSQVTPDPTAETKLYQQKIGGLTVTEVYQEGTLLPSTMGTGPSSPEPDSALYGIILEGAKEGNVFVKVTGAKAAMRAAMPALATLADSAKLAQ